MKHELKILKPFFQSVIDGDKKFEVRDNSDRGFQKGDLVRLREVEEGGIVHVRFTGRNQNVKITYVSSYNQPRNQVVFAFKLIN